MRSIRDIARNQGDQNVAPARHGLNESWGGGIVVESFAYLNDGLPQYLVGYERVGPNGLEQSLAGKDLSGVTSQIDEEIHDFRLNMPNLARSFQSVQRWIDLPISQVEVGFHPILHREFYLRRLPSPIGLSPVDQMKRLRGS
jgi:hypothetical protein